MSNVSTRGQIVIPIEIRQRYGIQAGSKLEWQAWDSDTMLVRKKQVGKVPEWTAWSKSIAGLHKEIWGGIDPVEHSRSAWDA